VRVFLLTSAALVGFAANSLLTRSALAGARIDAATFTAVRLGAGASMWWLLVFARARSVGTRQPSNDSWVAALALAAYAVAFTLAYRRLGAGVGALALFGAVQVTMIGRGLFDGERPSWRDRFGWLLAVAGLAALTLPGATAPDVAGLALMIVAGACWGFYSLRGRSSGDALRATAGNFLRAALVGVIFAAVSPLTRVLSTSGLCLALASGALASGVGYAFWYAALPSLTAWRAAIMQLSVPILTAGGAVVLLGESLSLRLLGATLLVAIGVLLTVWPARARPAPMERTR
jgi:drug/metabolite transporter (DMT)-like permease